MATRYDVDTGRFVSIPSLCWRIARGTLTRAEIPDEGLPILVSKTDPEAGHMCALGGHEDADWPRSTLATVRDLAERIVPWTTRYCAPSFFGCEKPFDSWSGVAWLRSDVVLLRTNLGERQTVSTAYHEAWHLLEKHVTASERAAIDAAIDRGGVWATDYSDSAVERRARAFQHYAMHRHEAPPAARSGKLGLILDRIAVALLPPHEKVFLAAFEGRIGQRAATRRWVPAARLPEATRQRAAAERAAAARPVGDRVADAVIAAGALFDAALTKLTKAVTVPFT